MLSSSAPASEPQLPEIIVYPNKARTSVWIALCGVCSGLLGLGCLIALILLIGLPEAREAATLFLVLMLLGLAGLGFYTTRVLVNLLTSKAPMLLITHQGIRVGKLYGSFDIILLWEEIAAVYLHSDGIQKQLCIRPTNIKVFLSHFSPFMRFFLRINLMNGAPIAINQSFLDQPIGVILQQVEQRYAQELDEHQIWLPRHHIR